MLWLRWCECVDGCSEGGNMKEILLTLNWIVAEMISCWDAHGLVRSTGLVLVGSREAGWAKVGVGVTDLCENSCVLEFQTWGWGAPYVCRSADCCVLFHDKWNISLPCSWSCLFWRNIGVSWLRFSGLESGDHGGGVLRIWIWGCFLKFAEVFSVTDGK
jgi:hypothetical protein